MYPREKGNELDLLRFVLAVLNSTVGYWQVALQSSTYSRGYRLLEPRVLNQIRIPNPAMCSSIQMKRLQQLVKWRLASKSQNEMAEIESELDSLVAEMYGLSDRELREMGLEKDDAGG